MTYFYKVALWLDQGINVVFLAGYPDESLSARAYRWRRDGKRAWPAKIINALFFWQKDHVKQSGGSCRRNTEEDEKCYALPTAMLAI